MCGTKKLCFVFNDSSWMKGSLSLSRTYTAVLEQSGVYMLQSLTTLHNYTVYGDPTNAFVEGPPSVASLYVTIDKGFYDWWEEVKKRPPIPKRCVLPVQQVLQGHPESPLRWAKMSNGIL